jgi:hypothetical protein
MGRRGRQPDLAKREAFGKLIAEGISSARACRMVGIKARTGKRWRNGRKVRSGGTMLDVPPVIGEQVERYESRRVLSRQASGSGLPGRHASLQMVEAQPPVHPHHGPTVGDLHRQADSPWQPRPSPGNRRQVGTVSRPQLATTISDA